jgi:succinate dehydrogenase / fumarate reductase cytochrome b subunit
MLVHMGVNLTALAPVGGPGMYQKLVYQIHGLGGLLPIVEWSCIFLPILFHGILGLLIIRGGLPNTGSYPYAANVRFSLQRITGIIAFVYIVYHVFHMHGWFHFEAWLDAVARPLGGASFRPYNAASSLRSAMQGLWVPTVYAIGLAACTFHLANGVWTMGITWGIWTSPKAQRGAAAICGFLGVGVGLVSIGALAGSVMVDVDRAVEVEDRMYRIKVTSGEIDPEVGVKKRSSPGIPSVSFDPQAVANDTNDVKS